MVGRAGVGKTSWCNAHSGRGAPTGLGGTTPNVEVHPTPDGTVLLDTPGLDRPGVAAQLAAEPDIDGIVWILDGLAPVGAAERAAVAALRGEAPVVGLIARGDLVPEDERADVRERVRLRAGLDAPLVDLRRGPFPAVPALPVAPRRIHALLAAAERARAVARADAEPPDVGTLRTALRDAWHRRVRDAANADPTAWRRAVAALPDALLADLATWQIRLPPGRPALPDAPVGPRKTAAARLAIDGDVALDDWLTNLEPDPGAVERLAAVEVLIAELRLSALGTSSARVDKP